jgi:hypothetical protein
LIELAQSSISDRTASAASPDSITVDPLVELHMRAARSLVDLAIAEQAVAEHRPPPPDELRQQLTNMTALASAAGEQDLSQALADRWKASPIAAVLKHAGDTEVSRRRSSLRVVLVMAGNMLAVGAARQLLGLVEQRHLQCQFISLNDLVDQSKVSAPAGLTDGDICVLPVSSGNESTWQKPLKQFAVACRGSAAEVVVSDQFSTSLNRCVYDYGMRYVVAEELPDTGLLGALSLTAMGPQPEVGSESSRALQYH